MFVQTYVTTAPWRLICPQSAYFDNYEYFKIGAFTRSGTPERGPRLARAVGCDFAELAVKGKGMMVFSNRLSLTAFL